MGIVAVILIAIGLCFDTLAVSLSCSCGSSRVSTKDVIRIAVIFGLFQGLMPLIGYFIGQQLTRIEFIAKVDHWLAFGLLLVIGGNMIWNAVKTHKDGEKCHTKLSNMLILTLALATSIDALATGISFAFALNISIWLAVGIIGVITALVAVMGLYSGAKAHKILGDKVEILGGLILIAIGSKVLVEHLLE